jgi:hypothetical protein
MDICKKAELIKAGAQDKPLVPIKIVDCDELSLEGKLTSATAEYLETYNRENEEETPEDKRVEI